MKRLVVLLLIFFSIGSVGLTASAAEIRNEDSITIENSIQDDSFFTAQTVQVKAPIVGELFSAGRTVEITAKPSRSLFAAGNTVNITEGAGYNVFAAGNTIEIGGVIEHDVFVAGKSIVFKPNTHIKGSLRVGGTLVELAGKIDGDVSFSAQRLESGAEIGKSLKGDANQVTFTGGSIGGDLIYRSNLEAINLESLPVGGKTERTPLASNQRSQMQGWLLSLLTTFIMGAALLLLIPTKINDLSLSIRQEWGKSFLIGLAILLLSPVAIILLLSSVVAWPLALIWAVFYIILIYITFIISEILVGMHFLRRIMPDRLNWWWSLIVGAILISFVRIIPAIGPILLLIMMIGITIPLMGATLLWWNKKLSVSQN